MTKVYCPGGYTHGNRGDALLILSLDALLVERFGADAERTYATLTPAADTVAYGLPCVPMVVPIDGRVLGPVARLARRTRRPDRVYVAVTVALLPLLFAWSLLARLRPDLALRVLPAGMREAVTPILTADEVVSVPGGYLLAPVVHDHFVVSHVLTFATVHFLGKPVTISPCSIGPAAGAYEPLLAWLLKRMQVIVLREQKSFDWVTDRVRGARRPPLVLLACDLAFADAVPTQPVEREVPVGTVGVSVKLHTYPGSDARVGHQRYLREIAAFVEDVAREAPEVVFVPQVSAGGDDDVAVAREVVALLSPEARSKTVIEAADLTPGQLRELYGRLSVLVGTRMHANIISLLAGTPVIAIGYEAKTRGIMQRLGLEAFVVDIDQVTAADLRRLLDQLQAGRDGYLATLSAALPEVRHEARGWLLTG